MKLKIGLQRMWDKSRPPAAASKWRRVTTEELARQIRTAELLRREVAALKAGVPAPRPARKQGRGTGCASISQTDTWELRIFLDKHGHEIADVLRMAKSEESRIEVARRYRGILTGQQDGHVMWAAMVRSLSV